jgi:hypothetical protein
MHPPHPEDKKYPPSGPANPYPATFRKQNLELGAKNLDLVLSPPVVDIHGSPNPNPEAAYRAAKIVLVKQLAIIEPIAGLDAAVAESRGQIHYKSRGE